MLSCVVVSRFLSLTAPLALLQKSFSTQGSTALVRRCVCSAVVAVVLGTAVMETTN
jgi:hypothetical protein